MIDELDLAFDENSERGEVRSHRRGKAKGGKGKGGGTSAVAFLMAFILLALLGGGVFLGYNKIRDFFTAADYDGDGTGTVQVQIEDNATLTDVGNTLVDADVVKSTKAFTQAAEKNPKGKNIQAGTFNLKKQMSAKAAVTALLDPKSRIAKGVTLTPGMTSMQVFATLSKSTGVPLADYKKAAKNPEALGVPDFWFNRTDGQKVTKSIEGFLLPETYEFPPAGSAEDQLTEMVSHFLKVTGEMGFVDKVQDERKISPYEALTVASLSQAESGNKDDYGKVARVAYNRLYSDNFPCSCLQFDVGINYYYELTGRPKKASKNMTAAELRDPKNPYRTHDKPGLTPTPINNPGEDALKAAMSPPAGPWLYFVAVDKKGHSAFASTLEQHERNKGIARRNGVL